MTASPVDYATGTYDLHFGPVGPLGTARLTFPGEGFLFVDPGTPGRVVSMSVRNPGHARGTLRALLGEDLLATLLKPEPPGPDSPEPTARPGPQALSLCRLAFALWYERWTPLAIPRESALLDIGMAAAAAGFDRLAFDAFDEAVEYLLSAAAQFSQNQPHEYLQLRLADALAAASDALGPRHHAAQRLARARIELPPPRVSVPSDSRRLAALAGLTVGVVAGALSAQAPELLASGSVDWTLVPPRVLSPDEGALHTHIDAEAITIEADPHRLLDPRSPEASSLLARLVDPQTGRPIVSAPLVYDEGAREFIARIRRDHVPGDTILESLISDAYSLSATGATRLGADAEAARGQREQIRALVGFRAAIAAHVLDVDGSDAYGAALHSSNMAAAAFDAARSEDPGPERSRLYVESEAWVDDPPAASGPFVLPGSPGLWVPDSATAAEPLLSELLLAFSQTEAA